MYYTIFSCLLFFVYKFWNVYKQRGRMRAIFRTSQINVNQKRLPPRIHRVQSACILSPSLLASLKMHSSSQRMESTHHQPLAQRDSPKQQTFQEELWEMVERFGSSRFIISFYISRKYCLTLGTNSQLSRFVENLINLNIYE